MTSIVGGEREYAFDPADAWELTRWFAFSSIGVLGVAAVVAMATRWLVTVRWPSVAPHIGWIVFWSVAFLLGIVGTPIFNRWTGTFVFTWPVCLFVAHQVTLNTVIRAGRISDLRRARLMAFLTTCFLVVVCLAYYMVCRRLSLATEWAFLLGFLPSWPIAVPAAFRHQREGRSVGNMLSSWLAFTTFFWSAGGYLLWKAATL